MCTFKLLSYRHFQIRHYRPDEYVLTVRDVQRSDQGLYMCVVSNMTGTVRTLGQIDVGPRSAERVAADEERRAKEEEEEQKKLKLDS